MARYKDCDKCYHRYACAGDTDKWNYYGECPHYVNSADVVPKSEVEKIFDEIEDCVIGIIEPSFQEVKKKYTEEKQL